MPNRKNLKDEDASKKERSSDKQAALFPFDKMPYQAKSENEIHDYETNRQEELELGETPKRTQKRTLGEEREAGHEP